MALRDRHGRVATDLRVSLTDKCNLRCVYCMPEDGLPWLPREELLTDDELVRLVRIAVSMLGVTQVRLTGGEPLIRPGVVGLVERIAALEPVAVDRDHHQRARPGPAGGAAGCGGPDARQRLARHGRPGDFPSAHPA